MATDGGYIGYIDGDKQMMRVTEFRTEQARRVLPLARANNDADVIMACKRIMTGWLEGRLVERADIVLVDAFDPRA
jgi:hypothetical protein